MRPLLLPCSHNIGYLPNAAFALPPFRKEGRLKPATEAGRSQKRETEMCGVERRQVPAERVTGLTSRVAGESLKFSGARGTCSPVSRAAACGFRS